MEPGESAEAALARELRQETGLILNGKPVLHGAFFNQEVSKYDHVLVYICNTGEQIPANDHSLEIAELGFFNLDQIPDDINGDTLKQILEIL